MIMKGELALPESYNGHQ